MRGVEREVLEEWLLLLARDREEIERVVGEHIRAVKAVLRVHSLCSLGREAGVERVFLEARIEAADHAVELVEATVDRRWPLRPAKAPLADHGGVVAGGLQDLGESDRVRLREAAVARQSVIAGHVADAGLVRIEARHQARSRRAATRAVV